MKVRYITLGAILSAFAALMQLIPFFFSEMFVIVTIFSALPIFIISRINPKAGIASYLVAGLLVMLLSVHEALLFYFTNGVIGVSIGITGYYIKNKLLLIMISSLILTAALCTVNYGIGIPVFGGTIPGNRLVQLGIVLGFSAIYITIYYFITSIIYGRLKKIGCFNKFS